ncbi:MAG: ribosome small subunit-dependent GTPase A [Gelidibacter sp.]|nr:ribosome small subunit-dependent GTPase A [Gelidibacter sp.]
MTGVVYKSTGSWYTVKTELGAVYECRIKGKFRIKGIKSTNPIAVGDVVDFDIETLDNVTTGIIHTIHDRTNYIVRKSVNLSKQTHIIASNIDQVFLLITINNPPTLTSFIDRFLVTTQAYGIKTILLFNKVDSYDDETLLEVKYLASVYRKIGYECIGVSAVTGKNVDKVKALMKEKVSMFAGHSGVGKSTLVNAIEPELDLKTKEISMQHMQGQHTTTFAEMHTIDIGGAIIDTPGIKTLSFNHLEPMDVAHNFREFFEQSENCKFGGKCLHRNEPGCAVKKAIEAGEISELRYMNYLTLLEEIEGQNYWERLSEEY